MKGLIFNLNGTVVDDLDHHVRAWLYVLNRKLGCFYNYEQVRAEMHGSSGEVLKRIFGEKYFSAFELEHLCTAKEERYRELLLPRLQLLPGLEQFLETATAYGVPMALAAPVSGENIDFVLDNLDIRGYFEVVVGSDDVPQAMQLPRAAALLGLAPISSLVFADTPRGVAAAADAGMKAIVLTTSHQPPDFRGLNNIAGFWNNYYLAGEAIFKN